jgi:signal transduction histidine kinase
MPSTESASPLNGQYKDVLVLSGFGPNIPWTKSLLEGYALAQTKFPEYRFYFEFLYLEREVDISLGDFHQTLLTKYDLSQFDAVIGHTLQINRYFEEYGDDYGQTPKLLLSSQFVPLSGNVQYVSSVQLSDIHATFDTLLALHSPQQPIYLILMPRVINADYEQNMVNGLRKQYPSRPVNVIRYSDFPTYQRAVKTLPSDAIVFYFPIQATFEGVQYNGTQMLQQTKTWSDLPIYSFWELFLGKGIIGGSMILPVELIDNMISSLNAYFVTGEFLPSTAKGQWMFDYNELKAHQIDHAQLPPNSHIINQPIPIWQVYPLEFSIAIVLFSSLLLMLFVTRYLIAQRHLATQRKLRVKAQQSAKAATNALATKDRFLHAISHELRTPINGIVGAVEQLAQHTASEDKRYLDMVNYCSQSLHHTVNDILDYAKFQTQSFGLDCKTFNVVDMLNSQHKYLDLISQHKDIITDCRYDIAPDTCLIGDKHRIIQLINNLINNAVKFTPSGKVSLTAHIANIGKRFGNTPETVELQIAVEDTGIGIKEADQGQLFKPFSQVDTSITREQTGSGLGLSICALLLEKMQGDISFKSTVDKGSVFCVRIPLKQAKDEQMIVPNTYIDEALLKPLKVLVVEDNFINQELIKVQLNDAVTRCHFAGHGKDALTILQEQQDIDVILMDLQMPVMDGYSCAIAIRNGEAGKTYRKLPIIALTAHMTLDDTEQQQAKFADIIQKPFTQTTLLAGITRVLMQPQYKRKSP